MADIASLFAPVPARWGLRGDVHLWADLRARFVLYLPWWRDTAIPLLIDRAALP